MNDNSKIVELMRAQKFAEALPLLAEQIDAAPTEWSNYYMAGQCARFINEFDAAVSYLEKAASPKSDDAAVLLAYGIALQLTKKLPQAVRAFQKAILIDPEYDLAFNSLAITLEEQGDLHSALQSYDLGLKALTRRLVKSFRNDNSSEMLQHDNSPFHHWFEHAMTGALFIASSDRHVDGIATPSASLALEEEQTERHRGLYWIDQRDTDGKNVRLFLPNYFNTFREALRRDRVYSTIQDNKALLLENLGRVDEAKQYVEEARYFRRPLHR